MRNAILLDLSVQRPLTNSEHFRRASSVPFCLLERGLDHRTLNIRHLRPWWHRHHIRRRRLFLRLDGRGPHPALGLIARAYRRWPHLPDPTFSPPYSSSRNLGARRWHLFVHSTPQLFDLKLELQ